MLWIAKTITVALIALSGVGFLGYSQTRIDELREQSRSEELLYLPNKSLLTHFTAGLSNVVADLLWLETIRYTVQEFHNPDRKFTWLEQMCHAVTDLDPYFVGAYTHGGMFMSSIGADEKALRLLEKGFKNNPDSWEIPYEIVKVHVLNRKDRPESPAIATHYLRMVAERHEHPESYLNWARRIQELNNLDQEAYAIWEDVLATSSDPFIRELAEGHLRILVVRDSVKVLEAAAESFARNTGRPASSVYELAETGYVDTVPNEEEYGRYFFDDEGVVQNTLLLEELKGRMLVGINVQGRLAAKEHGRIAASMDEWLEWYGHELPEHPLPGHSWQFDPETGELQ